MNRILFVDGFFNFLLSFVVDFIDFLISILVIDGLAKILKKKVYF